MAHQTPMVGRRCTVCLETKPYREFHTRVGGAHSMRAQCKACVKAKRLTDPLPARRAHLRRAYGLTLADYEGMFQDQGGLCAICRRPERPGKLLAVDHCHTTGRVRGLLCLTCNTGLGKLGDTPESIRGVLAYLEK